MTSVWKALLGLALVVPLGAYVAGSLAASASDDEVPRRTIRIDEPGRSTTAHPTADPTADPTAPSSGPSSGPSRGSGTGVDESDDDVEVITPDYDSLDDHGGSSGHGGSDHSGSDHSGSGHGGGGGDD